MRAFTAPLDSLEEYGQIKERIKKNQGVLQVSGCIDSQKSHFIYCIGENYGQKLILTYSDLRAREIYENYRFFDRNVLIYPARDLMFYNADIQSHQIGMQRMMVQKSLMEEEDITVIATLPACMERILPLAYVQEHVLEFQNDSSLDLQKLSAQLVEMGYEKMPQVEAVGQFAIRGGIVDVFPLTKENPIRIELWGDEIDSIRSFDSLSQRSIENLDSIRIYPANEVLVSMEQASKAMEKIRQEGKNQEAVFRQSMRTEEAFHIKTLVGEIQEKLMDLQERKGLDNLVPYFYQKTVSFLDYLKEDAMIFLDEPNRISQEGSAVEKEFAESMENRLNKGYILPSQTELLYGCMEIIGRLNRRNCLGLCIMDANTDEKIYLVKAEER